MRSLSWSVGLVVALFAVGCAEPLPEQEERGDTASNVKAATIGLSCETEDGVCPIDPQPVGSVCYCGDTPGFTRRDRAEPKKASKADDAEEPDESEESEGATMGFHCETSRNTYPTPPQPIGSVCYVGAEAGFTVP